jgi:hypothetical protein
MDQAASAAIANGERSEAFSIRNALIIFNPLGNNVLLEESVVQAEQTIQLIGCLIQFSGSDRVGGTA